MESEIRYLCNEFDEVLIVATAIHATPIPTRQLPPNAISVALSRPSGKKKFLWGIAQGMRYAHKDLFEEIKNYPSTKKALAALYDYGRYQTIYHDTHKIIEDFVGTITLETHIVFYSYWFVETAQIATVLRNQVRKLGGQAEAITRAHGFDLYKERSMAKHFPFRTTTLRALDAVYPCSQNGTEYLQKGYSDFGSKIVTEYLGTAEHGANGKKRINDFCLVTCSSLVAVKRVDLLLKALAICEKQCECPPFLWVCIGDGPQRKQLETSVHRQLRHTRVQFLGNMENMKVIDWYSQNYIDLFINVSESEGLPVSIMEAQSFGIPVLATDVGGTAEIIHSGENGQLLPKELTSEQLAQEIISFMKLPKEKIKQLRKNSREIWQRKFSAEKNYEQFAKLLCESEME